MSDQGKTWRTIAKDNITAGPGESFEVKRDRIVGGSLQRIADATEKMAASYDALRNERDCYRQWYEEARANEKAYARQSRALRGVITRMKRKAARS